MEEGFQAQLHATRVKVATCLMEIRQGLAKTMESGQAELILPVPVNIYHASSIESLEIFYTEFYSAEMQTNAMQCNPE